MKGSTQPMKRLLVLLPLLLVGCTNDKISDNSHTIENKVYQNVSFGYVLEKHCYLVYVENNEYYVPPKNFYSIKIDGWLYTNSREILENEYFVSTNELFVYYVK